MYCVYNFGSPKRMLSILSSRPPSSTFQQNICPGSSAIKWQYFMASNVFFISWFSLWCNSLEFSQIPTYRRSLFKTNANVTSTGMVFPRYFVLILKPRLSGTHRPVHLTLEISPASAACLYSCVKIQQVYISKNDSRFQSKKKIKTCKASAKWDNCQTVFE